MSGAKHLTWMVAVSPSRRMISPISFSAPTLTSSYMADPLMLLATTTGPDTLRTYLRAGHGDVRFAHR